MPEGAVVVTGASSGIGAACARALAQAGYLVFAGIRNEADAPALRAAHARIRPLTIDVGDATAIRAAAATVTAAGVPLRGLINNAGIGIAGPLEYLPIADIRRQFEVNVFGAIAVTQAFLPELRASRGRIVFIGSISGRLPMPFIAPYSSSKFALRALADAWRVELAPAGVAVTLIEPGSVSTPMWSKGHAAQTALAARLGAPATTHYRTAFAALLRIAEREDRSGMPVERVSRAVVRALAARRPRAHHRLGVPARLGSLLALLPPALYDRAMRKSLGI